MSQEKTLGRALPGTGAAVDFSGSWINELSSVATFIQRGDALSGEYESTVSSDGTTTKGTVVGYVDGDLISFLVHWSDFQAITAWVGQINEARTQIDTLWQMTKQVKAGAEWSSINAGADTFTRKAG